MAWTGYGPLACQISLFYTGAEYLLKPGDTVRFTNYLSRCTATFELVKHGQPTNAWARFFSAKPDRADAISRIEVCHMICEKPHGMPSATTGTWDSCSLPSQIRASRQFHRQKSHSHCAESSILGAHKGFVPSKETARASRSGPS
jgi:hypothetical protein